MSHPGIPVPGSLRKKKKKNRRLVFMQMRRQGKVAGNKIERGNDW